jgi:hypothetical protein
MRWGLLAAAATVAALTVVATADVTLHPGTVQGNTGLTNWSFDGGSVSVGGNANSFSGSSAIATNSYAITVEGAQTYNSLSESLYKYSPSYTTFSRSVTSPLTVPVGGTVSADLLASGATIQLDVTASANTTVYLWGYASGGDAVNSYYGYTSGGAGPSTQVPMAATGATISVYVYASFSIQDGTGATCQQSRSYSATLNGINEGDTVHVANSEDFSSYSCPVVATGSMSGTIALNGAPASTTASPYIYASGPSYASASGSALPFAYSFPALMAGSYYTQAYVYFSAPFASTLYLPNGANSSTDVQAGQNTTRDFIFDTATVQGNFLLNGPLAALPVYGYASVYAPYSYPYPANYGGSSQVSFQGPGASLPYGQILTPGTWQPATRYLYWYGANEQVSIYDYANEPAFSVASGDALTVDRTIDTSEGDVVFDVIEPPNTPTIGISSPYIQASMSDSTTGRSAQVYAQSYDQNAATPTVHVIGPPGHYQFTAYAQVLGSWTTFASSAIDLGVAANTPAGANVPVSLLDANGNNLDVNLNFSNVTSGGETTGSTTSIGPAPAGSFTIVPAFNGADYLSINTTATFSGPVRIQIAYDPSQLGIGPGQEQFLQLWHYNCASSPCFWENITDPSVVPNPNIALHEISGVTTSFSVFAIMLPPHTANPPNVACVGSAGAPTVLATPANACGLALTNANGFAGTCSDAGGGLQSCTFDGAASLSLVPGTYQVLVQGTASDGVSTAACTSYVQVADLTRPAETLSASPSVLWPPNHALVPIDLAVNATDACSQPTVSCTATSNQAPTGGGSGNTSPDIVWTRGQLYLRAERAGSGGDRVYTVSCNATDASGNVTSATTTVTVPHDKR